jgi:hypothetical protein
MTLGDNDWSREDLMGKNVSFRDANGDVGSTPTKSHNKDKIDPMLWGRPGHLSDEEADTYVSDAVDLQLLLLLLLVADCEMMRKTGSGEQKERPFVVALVLICALSDGSFSSLFS